MLSPASTPVVRATLPVVGAAIDDITPRLLPTHVRGPPRARTRPVQPGQPGPGRPAAGARRRHRGVATLLVAEDGPDPPAVLGRIAHKHASLGITADQYAIVHKHLFAAIVEVLGDAVTPEVAAAWDEVYWLMANTLIAIEEGLYAAAGVAAGRRVARMVGAPAASRSPPTRPLRARARRRRRRCRPSGRASTSRSRCGCPTAPADPPVQPDRRAGRRPSGRSRSRPCRHRGDGDAIVPAGEVSGFLHHNVFEGDEVTVSAPFGDLVLDESDAPLVLVSAGIGSPRSSGCCDHLARRGPTREVSVVHADRSPARHAHRAGAQGAGGGSCRRRPCTAGTRTWAPGRPATPRTSAGSDLPRSPSRGHPGLPVRPAALHGVGPGGAAGPGAAGRADPLRGVRPGHLAGHRLGDPEPQVRAGLRPAARRSPATAS